MKLTFLHNRHVDPKWLILLNFPAHFWVPVIEGPQKFAITGPGEKIDIFEKLTGSPSIRILKEFYWSKLSFWYLETPKYAISGAWAKVDILSKTCSKYVSRRHFHGWNRFPCTWVPLKKYIEYQYGKIFQLGHHWWGTSYCVSGVSDSSILDI